MSWFKRKNSKPKHKKVSWKEKAVDDLKKFRDIGETFNYLGRTCIVTSHIRHDMCLGSLPALLCDYVDKHGVIRNISFGLDELTGLIKQQEEKKVSR